MSDPLLDYARDRFGVDFLFPYQRLVVTNLLETFDDDDPAEATERAELGRQIVILPTGAGKSLCFQLPAAIVTGLTLVVYPLLGLMNDQERRMRKAGFRAEQLRGGQSREERLRIFDAVKAGELDFLLTNPETLCGEHVRRELSAAPPVHAVLDEAHCVSEWGDTFRPAYLTLGESLGSIGTDRITAFTATASDRVIARIREVLFGRHGARVVRANPDRENISYTAVPVLSLDRALLSMYGAPGSQRPAATNAMDTLPVWKPGNAMPRPSVVFCRTRAETERIARILTTDGACPDALFYHAGLARDRKREIEEQFFESDSAVLAATCAYGMGVDKQNIRSVVHTYVPDTAEAFLQESGRGGRDRAPAVSALLITPSEQTRYRRADARGEASPVQRMAFGEACRRATVLSYFGIDDSACSGCDRCEGDAPPLSLPTALVLEALAAVPHPRSGKLWAATLRGRASHAERLRGAQHFPAYGALSDWTLAQVECALDELLTAGFIMERRGRLILGPEAQRGRTDLPLPFRRYEIGHRSSPPRRRRMLKDGLA